MKTSKLLASAALGAVLIAGPVAGIASADRGPRPVCVGLEAAQSTATCPAGVAGSVTIQRDGNILTVLSVQPNAGFTARVDRATGREVEVRFTKASGARFDFKAEVEDGVVETRLVRK